MLFILCIYLVVCPLIYTAIWLSGLMQMMCCMFY